MVYKGVVNPQRVDWMLPIVCKLVIDSGRSFQFISYNCGVSTTTLRSWMSGKTKRPQRITMEFVLRAIGYDMAIIQTSTNQVVARTEAKRPMKLVATR